MIGRTLELQYVAKSFISHGDEENLSTIMPFRRQKTIYNGKFVDIPVITGNSVRGKLRRIGARDLLKRLGIGLVSQRLYHLLHSGGALESTGDVIDVGRVKRIRRLLPLISLFGGSLDNQLIPGRLDVGFVVPIGRETYRLTGIKSETSVFEYLELAFYTRKEDYEPNEGEQVQTAQMKYEVEVLVPGTPLYQRIFLKTDEQIELACFNAIVTKFLEYPTFGSNSRVGHGLVELVDSKGLDELPSPELYYEHIESNKEEIARILEELS